MMKRGMKAVLCCLSLMGILSMDVLPVQAAWCEHKICYTAYESVKAYHYEQDGHYMEVGTVHICADCGHEEWENLTYEWYESHTWKRAGAEVLPDGALRIWYECTNPNCDATLG